MYSLFYVYKVLLFRIQNVSTILIDEIFTFSVQREEFHFFTNVTDSNIFSFFAYTFLVFTHIFRHSTHAVAHQLGTKSTGTDGGQHGV